VLYADSLIQPGGYGLISRLTGAYTSTLGGWIAAIDAVFDRYGAQCATVKIALAYGRPLSFDPAVTRHDAEPLYARHRVAPLSKSEVRPLEDYLFYQVLQHAVERHLPIQLHTGAYSGANYVNNYSLRDNVKDVAELAIAHP